MITYQPTSKPIESTYLKVGLNGIGTDVYEEHFWEFQPIRFQYLYVGLPALDAVQFLDGDNWLGWALASLMNFPKEKAAWLGAEALQRITKAKLTDQQRFLLVECVDAYLSLDEAQMREFQALIKTEKYAGVQAMNQTTFEKGIEKGEEKGRRKMLREQLEARFGPLSATVQERLERLSLQELVVLGKAVLRAQSLRELGLDEVHA